MALHLLGVSSDLADFPSTQLVTSYERFLHGSIAEAIVHQWGYTVIDLFAMKDDTPDLNSVQEEACA